MTPNLNKSLQQHPDWNYDDQDELGPKKWPKYFSVGEQQSPINITIEPSCIVSKQATCCANRLKEALNISGKQQEGAAKALHTRPHLDSVGEESRERSSSALSGSTASSNRSSPVQATSSDYYEDEFELEPEEDSSSAAGRRRKQCRKQQQVVVQQNTRFCLSNKKIFLGYPRYLSTAKLENSGHSWQVSLPNELASHTLLTGPSLADREYRLAQFHCHWGEDCDHGSEHQVNGKHFSAEIHFVHWNCTDFSSPEEASRHKHGLAVLAVLVQALDGEQHRNKHLDKIIRSLEQVQNPGSSTNLNSGLDLKKLFPANRWFYASYEGSLTTPPLSEVVDWIVFLSPVQCSTSQIRQFQQMRCNSRGNKRQIMRKNCRPVQPLNNRLISIWSHH